MEFLAHSCSMALLALHVVIVSDAVLRHASRYSGPLDTFVSAFGNLPNKKTRPSTHPIGVGLHYLTLPLAMISLAAVHAFTSHDRYSATCGQDHDDLLWPDTPRVWLGAWLLLTNLMIYVTCWSLLNEKSRATSVVVGTPGKKVRGALVAAVNAFQQSRSADSDGRGCRLLPDRPGDLSAQPSAVAPDSAHSRPDSPDAGTSAHSRHSVDSRTFRHNSWSDVIDSRATSADKKAKGTLVRRATQGASKSPAARPVVAITAGGSCKMTRSRSSPRDLWLGWQEINKMQDLARMAQIGSDDADLKGEPSPAAGVQAVEVLHVDDDPVQHLILVKLLKRYTDTTVTSVKSGEEALELLADRAALPGSVQNFPTLIVLDQMMPGIPGTTTARRIRDLYPQAWLPIIITSSLDAENIRSTGDYLASGVNDIITKPINKLSLVTTMACQLSNINLQRKNFLLRSILPDSIINRLTAGQKIIADKHESVSILFSDIVGYTSLSARTETPDLIQILNSMFTAFDRLTDRHGVHKVETIGDAYMAAAGHSEESAEDHSQRLINMAQDMLKATEGIKLSDGTSLRIRVGIHTGPAYAGVVGEKCPRYCFFGDTVNTASRMESTSFPQCIQVSQSTFGHLSALRGDGISGSSSAVGFCPLGSRDIKGKGEMETFLVEAGDWVGVTRPDTYAGDESPGLAFAPLTPCCSGRSSLSSSETPGWGPAAASPLYWRPS